MSDRRPPNGSNYGPEWDQERPRNPNSTTVGGAGYRGGPMAPGPAPGSTVHRWFPTRAPDGSIVGNHPPSVPANRSIAGRPDASLTGRSSSATRRGTSLSKAVAVPIAPPESLLSGNLRRLWLSEVASITGDAILGAGVVIWYTQLTFQVIPVALLLLVIALPRALIAFMGGALAARRDPRRLLLTLDVLRIALAALFIAMHYHTIESLVLVLAFGLSLASNLRSALRRAALANGVPVRARGVLASGDQVMGGILAVAGPAAATLLYILNGERIFTIAIGAAGCYLLALLGESQVEPLPEKILYQRPAGLDQRVANMWEGDEDPDADPDILAAENEAQVWELAPPPNAGAALQDVRAGLGLAGMTIHAQGAFWGLTLLAGIGGAVAVAEPFFVVRDLHLAPFMLGLLFTATGLGAAIASAIVVEFRRGGRIFLPLGLLASGVGLIALPNTGNFSVALGWMAVIGGANVLALRGGQMILMQHFVPIGQRAVSSALTAFMALAAVPGVLAGLLALKSDTSSPTTVFALAGLLLLLGGVLTSLEILMPDRDLVPPEPVPLDGDEDWEEEDAGYSDYQSARYPATGYDDSRRYEAYGGEEAYSDEYEAPRSRRARRDDDDEPPMSPRRRLPSR